MLNFPFPFGYAQNMPANFPHPQLILQWQRFQQMFQTSEYPVYKQQKLEPEPSSTILDPDVFFKKEADFNQVDFNQEDEGSMTYQTTEVSSLAMSSPARSPTRDPLYNSFSDIVTPEQSPIEPMRKNTINISAIEPDQQMILTQSQLADMITSKLSAENTGLALMIEQVLQGRVTSTAEMIGLTPLEECVVEAILKKKDLTQQSKKQKGKKREEEKQKFFFKNLLKYTETKFFDSENSQKKRTKKKQLRKEAYYEYYWGQVAKEQQIDLCNFFHPNKKLSSGKTTAQNSTAQNPGLKSLNTTYIELILSSDKFKADTIDYLENVFLKEARISRFSKISKLISKLSSLALEAKNKTAHLPITQQIEAIKGWLYDYLVANPKSKLPWADTELLEARNFAYGTILRQSSKIMKSSF